MPTPVKLGRSPRIEIRITAEDIESSKLRDSSHCMIAEAIRSSYRGASHIGVDVQTIRFSDRAKGRRYTYLTPRSAQLAIIQFDQGVTPEPFKFRLRAGQTTVSGRGKRSPKVSMQQPEGGTASQARETVPEKVGGRTPPVIKHSDGTPHARRRQFGLRGFDL